MKFSQKNSFYQKKFSFRIHNLQRNSQFELCDLHFSPHPGVNFIIYCIQIMQKLKSLITSFDMAPVSYTPTINSRKNYKSCCCGCFSICCLVFLLFYIIILLFQILDYHNFDISKSLEHGTDAKNTQSMHLEFNITLQQKNGSQIHMTQTNQFQNGLNFTFLYKYKSLNSSKEYNSTMDYYGQVFFIPFQKCDQCDSITLNENTTQYYQVILRRCNPSDSKCHPFNENISEISILVNGVYWFSNIEYFFFANHDFHYILEKESFSSTYNLKLQNRKTKNQMQIIYLINGLSIFVETGIFPFPFNLILSFIYPPKYQQFYENYYEDTREKSSIDDESILHLFSFEAGNDHTNYFYSAKTIDYYFGNIFGTITIITFMISILSCGFKNWLMQIQIAKSLHKDQEKQMMKSSFVNYFKYKFSFIKQFEKAKFTKQKIIEAEKSLDIVEMAKKMQKQKEQVAKKIEKLIKQNEKLKKILKQKMDIEIQSESEIQQQPQKQIEEKETEELKIQLSSEEQIEERPEISELKEKLI